MKLCFLAAADSIHSKRWIEYFANREHEIHWISLTPNCFGDIKNVKLYLMRGFAGKALDILFNAIPVRRLIKKINPDILHAHYAGVNGALGALSGFHPFVLTAWGSDVLIATKSRIVKPLIKFALNKADLITCDADHMREGMIKLGVPVSKIKIIYFGVDTQKFSQNQKDEELLNKLEIFDSPTVISLRNFELIYDVETLIKAIPLILKEIPEVKFIIAGKGSQEKRLKTLAKNLKVSENIRFIGWISNEELPQYLRTADIYVSTALSDAGLSSSTAEAMACGLPVVITDSGENKKWIKNGENGYLISIKNLKILAEKIVYLLKNKAEMLKLGKNGMKTIEEKNNYYKEMEKMEQLYKIISKSTL